MGTLTSETWILENDTFLTDPMPPCKLNRKIRDLNCFVGQLEDNIDKLTSTHKSFTCQVLILRPDRVFWIVISLTMILETHATELSFPSPPRLQKQRY